MSAATGTTPAPVAAELAVEYCGEWFPISRTEPFGIGRVGGLDLDDNPFLHRRFLLLRHEHDLWWLENIGTRLSATVTDGAGGFQAWLSPGSRLPIVFTTMVVIFTAGPTTYEFTVHAAAPSFRPSSSAASALAGATTVGATTFTAAQRLLILSLAEPLLRRDGTGTSDIPGSAAAAERLGWTLTRFNRKLDNVCEKLDRAGVVGLRGGAGALATHRRARLVEYAVSTRLVTRVDLPLLDLPHEPSAD